MILKVYERNDDSRVVFTGGGVLLLDEPYDKVIGEIFEKAGTDTYSAGENDEIV